MELKQVLHKLEKIRPQVAMLGVSGAFLVIIGILLDGLRDILWPVLLLFVAELIPLMAVRTFGSRLMARSVVAPLRSGHDLEDHELDALGRALDGFALKDSAWIFLVWTIGAIILEFIVWQWLGATPWQMILMTTIAFIAALTEAMLAFHDDKKLVGMIKARVEGLRFRSDDGTSLVSRLLVAYFVVLLMVLSVSVVVWLDKDTSSRAKEILEKDTVAFLSAARRTDDILKSGKTASFALKNAGAGVGNWKGIIVSATGKITAGKADVDRGWLGLIVKSNSGGWLDKHAPFLYLRKALGGSQNLFWIQENNLVSLVFWKLGIWVIFASALMAFVGVLLFRSIILDGLRPLARLTDRLKAVIDKPMDEDLNFEAGGEIGQLSRGLAEFVGNIRSVLHAGRSFADELNKQKGRLSDRINALRSSSEHREEIAEQTASSILEMRMSVDSIAEQVETLKVSSTDCSSSLFEIDQSVREVSSSAENLQSLVDDAVEDIIKMTTAMRKVESDMDKIMLRADDTNASISAMGIANTQVQQNISQTNSLIEQVSEIATDGARSVEETISGINEIQLVTHEARDVINSLSQQMTAVGKILTVISDVAKQTNLLALNAAIIAAAAGEHGKSFAVVADEIKDLADRTATSTKEISGLIKSVQADSRRAVSAMERGSNSVNKGVQLANKAGSALQKILGSVSEVLRMAGEIHESTKAHGNLAASISRSMADMDDILVEVRQSMSEQTSGGEHVQKVAEQLRDDAKFVDRSAAEQVQAVTSVSRSMEKISEMIGFVAKAIAEQSQGIGHVAKAAEEVRDSSSLELQRLAEVEEVIDLLGRAVEDLTKKSGLDKIQGA